MPNCWCSTFTTGARQFVVQEAFEMIWCFADGYYNRKKDFPFSDISDYTRFRVFLKDHNNMPNRRSRCAATHDLVNGEGTRDYMLWHDEH